MLQENKRKPSGRRGGDPDETQTGYLPNTNVDRYRYTNLLDLSSIHSKT
jgi:hypothetical protein